MTKLLPDLFNSDLFPLAELSALKLKGFFYQLPDRYFPADYPLSIENRCRVVFNQLPETLVAERETAAWILGYTLKYPRPLRFLSRIDQSSTRFSQFGIEVKEVLLNSEDSRVISGYEVTTPKRLIMDLAKGWTAGNLGESLKLASTICRVEKIDPNQLLLRISNSNRTPYKKFAVSFLKQLAKNYELLGEAELVSVTR